MKSDPQSKMDPLPLPEKDKRYLSNEEYVKIISLEYILNNYRKDDYVSDNIKYEIAKIRSENSKYFEESEKIYISKQKTTKVTYNKYEEYNKDTIRALHQRDSLIIAFSSFAFPTSVFGELGPILSTLMTISQSVEQNGYIDTKSLLITLGEELANKGNYNFLSDLFETLSEYDTVDSLINENREIYTMPDGFVVQEGDSSLKLNLSYDLGKTVIEYVFYFRENILISVNGYNGAGRTQGSFIGMEEGIKRQWLKEGYVGRETS